MPAQLIDILTTVSTGLMVSFGLIVAIGAQNAWVLNKSLKGEHPWAITTVCFMLDATLITIGVFSISTIQKLMPPLIPAITLMGIGLLVWLSAQAFYRAWQGGGSLVTEGGADIGSPWRSVGQALAISLLNPHVYLDTVILIGSVGAQQTYPGGFIVGAGSASAIWFYSLAIGAKYLRPKLSEPHHWQVLDALTGSCLLLVAILLVQKL